jgi:protein phosphatase
LGRTREHNEDTFLVADLSTGNASLHADVRTHEIGPRGSLFMVADGMGGAAAGELASAMAADFIFRHLSSAWAGDPDGSAARFAYRMKEAVELANEKIYTYAREHSEVRGMGTTVTAAGVFGDDLYLTQIGDSRAYLVRNGAAIQLTKDQSLMQRLVDAGELTEEEAEQSERRNIILQALGPDPRVKVDLTYQSLRRGDTLIICSDGLSGLVRREEFGPMVLDFPDLPDLCGALIDLANERGGPDNITVVTARFEGDVLPEPNAAEDVGYQVYRPPDANPVEEPPPSTSEPEPEPDPEPVEEPPRAASGGAGPRHGLLVMAALLAVIALLLTVLL